jgi:hypothetical protein
MAGTVVADTLQADSTSTLVLKNGVANTPPTIQDSAGTQIGTFCRAWVNFNGTTVTNPASMTGVNGSFNVSSVLDNGTGDYTVNFTTAMPDANYCVTQVLTGAASVTTLYSTTAPTTTAYRFGSRRTDTLVAVDPPYCNIAVFR